MTSPSLPVLSSCPWKTEVFSRARSKTPSQAEPPLHPGEPVKGPCPPGWLLHGASPLYSPALSFWGLAMSQVGKERKAFSKSNLRDRLKTGPAHHLPRATASPSLFHILLGYEKQLRAEIRPLGHPPWQRFTSRFWRLGHCENEGILPGLLFLPGASRRERGKGMTQPRCLPIK